MTRLATYFLRGLVVVVPLAVTAYVCWAVFTTIDRWIGFRIPGVGFVATVALITLAGFLASSLVTRGVLAGVESLLNRLPLVRLVYTSTKDLLNAFVGEKRRFGVPVLVSLDGHGLVRAIGFVTHDSLGALGLDGHVAVYFPHSYAFAGRLYVVPAGRVARLDAPSTDVMAFVVSGGVTAIPQPATAVQPVAAS